MNTLQNLRGTASFPAAENDGRPDLAEAVQGQSIPQNDRSACFDIYRADEVSLTSTLFGGGDWHWRLTGSSGSVLADCGGYRNQAECRAVVESLRNEAGLATVLKPTP